MSRWLDLHIVGEQLEDCQWEGGGKFCAHARWDYTTRYGAKGPHAGGFDASSDNPWAAAAVCARLTRESIRKWRLEAEACPYYLPLFEGVKKKATTEAAGGQRHGEGSEADRSDRSHGTYVDLVLV